MVQPSPGILLIADPFLKDPNFKRAVVLLCEHQEEGSFGFVLNKAFSYTLDELVPGFDKHSIPVFVGGPVQPDTIHFLHRYPTLIPGSFEIAAGIYWGGNFETLTTLINNGQVDPGTIRFFIGYSGWSGGQLTDELKEKSWITSEATPDLIFHDHPEEIWKDCLRHLGGDYEMMVHYPFDPQLN
jgi:putative transcriptional regulator